MQSTAELADRRNTGDSLLQAGLRILGRVEAIRGGRSIPIHGVKARQLFTALLLNANSLVPVERLVDALWPHDPPRSALENLRTYSTTIRRVLRIHDDTIAVCLTASRSSYQLTAPPDSIDVDRFTSLVATARTELVKSRVDSAATRLSEALALWRGPAGEGLPREGWLGTALESLGQMRLIATEDRAEAWLRLGRHVELVPELLRLVSEEPLRERLWWLLMLANYRCGGTVEALNTYTRARRVLSDELGVEPGVELVDLHRAILRRDPDLAASDHHTLAPGAGPAPPVTAGVVGVVWNQRTDAPGKLYPVPMQIPAPPAVFVGNEESLAGIDAALRADVGTPAVAISISGSPGVGKSSLAALAAHRASDRFPDGQLYVDLRQFSGPDQAFDVLPVIHQMLRSLGCETSTENLAEASGLLRSSLVGRRMLIFIDNALHCSAVEQLLPGYPGSAAIITSTRVLGNSAITHHMTLDRLPDADAMSLFERVVGTDRVRAEASAATELVGLCHGEPIVIKALGTRLSRRNGWSIGTFRDHVRAYGGRLDQMRIGDTSLYDRITTAVRELRLVWPGATRLLVRLAAFDGIVDQAAVDRLVDAAGPGHRGDRAHLPDLDALVDFHLVETPTPGSYLLSEHVRACANELRDNTPHPAAVAYLGYRGRPTVSVPARPTVKAWSIDNKESHGKGNGTAG